MAKSKAGRAKTINEKLDQLYRLENYLRKTGRESSANKLRARTMAVGGVIGNMADRVTMSGLDPFSYQGMQRKVSFKNRTTSPTDEEYNAAIAKHSTSAKGGANG